MECTSNDPADKRIVDRAWLRDVVRLDEHEGIDDGRDERRDRGSRRNAVRREPGVQGVCELSTGGKLRDVYSFCVSSSRLTCP